jgi:hypothetical protein
MSSFSNPYAKANAWAFKGQGMQSSPFNPMGQQGSSASAFQNFLNQQQGGFQMDALEGMAGAQNPNTLGGQAFGGLMQDYMNTQTALNRNFQRGLGAEQGMMGVLGGLGDTQYGDQFEALAREQGQAVVDTAQQNYGELQGFIDEKYGESKSYYDAGIEKAMQTQEDYKGEQMALQKASSEAMMHSAQNTMQEIDFDQTMSPEQKMAAKAQLKHQVNQNVQARITDIQSRAEDNYANLGMQVAGMQQAAGAGLGQQGVSYAGLMRQGQAGVEQAQQFMGSLVTGGRYRGAEMDLQAKSMAMNGYGQLAGMIKANPEMFASAAPVMMAAINLSKMGLDPFMSRRDMTGFNQAGFMPTRFVPHVQNWQNTGDIGVTGGQEFLQWFQQQNQMPNQSF